MHVLSALCAEAGFSRVSVGLRDRTSRLSGGRHVTSLAQSAVARPLWRRGIQGYAERPGVTDQAPTSTRYRSTSVAGVGGDDHLLITNVLFALRARSRFRAGSRGSERFVPARLEKAVDS